MKQLTFEAVRSLCASRPLDLTIHAATPNSLTLVAEFDGYGEHFFIQLEDIEYIDFAPRVPIGDLALIDFSQILTISGKWLECKSEYSGPALVVRSDFADSWANAEPKDLFLFVANTISFETK